MHCTYSPEDNKLRLYAGGRLDPDTYQRVRAAGFIWAPKQELFVAPMWTPDRADLMIELCGEIGDEDTSLVDRAEERAERFEDYSDKREADAYRAREAVSAIADNIPLGQPILVGHHSERLARKDAERIENGMRKAVKMWETSKYWEQRAAGAIHHAKYKELPGVRARRIKGLEADLRKQEKEKKEAEMWLKLWADVTVGNILKAKDGTEGTPYKRADYLANRCHLGVVKNESGNGYWSAWDVLRPDGERYQSCPAMTAEQVQEKALDTYPKQIAHHDRWICHLNNRLTYERAMLQESGASDLLKPKPRLEQLPLCNYRAPDGITLPSPYHRGEVEHYPQIEMTKAEYAKIYTDYKGTRNVENSHRIRIGIKPGTHTHCFVFLTDSKVHEKPEPIEKKPVQVAPRLVCEHTDGPAYREPEPNEFDAIKDALRAGIKVVSAPQLFPTPPEIAAKMVEYADIEPGNTILEPSAGTGNILRAIFDAQQNDVSNVRAVEINLNLVDVLRAGFPSINITGADFLACNGNLGTFDRIIMNPPFINGEDIKHIQHARTMLNPGGRLVALCANGSRQRAAFMDIAEHWEDLPAGSFASQGTGVNVALMVLTA